jgi:UEV domain
MYHQVKLSYNMGLSNGISTHVACAPRVQISFGTGKPIGLSLATAQGHKYNIPVAVWLPERYPSQAPQLFVEPTPDMMISTNHAFVDASGGVRSSYIASWDASRWGFQARNKGTVIRSCKVASTVTGCADSRGSQTVYCYCRQVESRGHGA